MPEPLIEALYKAQCETIAYINRADRLTPTDMVLRWAKELARIDTEIDIRLKVGDDLPLVWKVRR